MDAELKQKIILHIRQGFCEKLSEVIYEHVVMCPECLARVELIAVKIPKVPFIGRMLRNRYGYSAEVIKQFIEGVKNEMGKNGGEKPDDNSRAV